MVGGDQVGDETHDFLWKKSLRREGVRRRIWRGSVGG